MITAIDLSADQEEALEAILAWREAWPFAGRRPLTLGGFAGTGKSTLVTHLAGTWEDVAVATITGKAAYVLRQRGVRAGTIHGLIYWPLRDAGEGWGFRRRMSLDGVQAIIIDEASAVNDAVFRDLLRFGLPTLFVGDHGQLEPIGKNPGLMAAPDVRLETIHRQERDNPIIHLAHAFREGRSTRGLRDPEGRLRMLSRRDFWKELGQGRQAIVGFNETRREVNRRVREVCGHRGLVCPGETLVCLRNNSRWGVFNGQQVTVQRVAQERLERLDLDVATDDGRLLTVPVLRGQFGRELIREVRSKDVVLMDYGSCLTAHKSQGSEYDDVIVLEEISRKWDARRWRYTAATRARRTLIYCA